MDSGKSMELIRFLISLAIALVFSWPAQGTDITVDSSYEPILRRNLQAVANDVWLIVQDMFHGQPPLDLPIVCHFNATKPITHLDNWSHPTKILIGLTPDGPVYAQFAYQLGHELGHVMLDPRRSNGVVETICSAVAYEVLDRLADRWAVVVPFPYLRGYGVNFRKYRIDDEQARLSRFQQQVRSAIEHHQWRALSRYLYAHRSEQEQLSQDEIPGDHGRDIQALGAIALRSTSVPWKKLIGFAGCSSVPLKKQPKFQVASIPASCLVHLSGALCPIGRGCPGLIP
jgi:hypothetical protein